MSVEAHLGKPPFEEPSITRAIVNFLFVKYGKSGDSELKTMLEVTKLFLYCLNMWKFETPTSFSKRITDGTNRLFAELNDSKNPDGIGQSNNVLYLKQQKIIALYKLNYTRWMCYNFVPSFCDSLEKYETIAIFGISFLKLVLPLIRQELQEKFIGEKEKMPGENRLIFSTSLPRLISKYPFLSLVHFY
jgi:histone acetyltransferase